jgi:hypothetical protein
VFGVERLAAEELVLKERPCEKNLKTLTAPEDINLSLFSSAHPGALVY